MNGRTEQELRARELLLMQEACLGNSRAGGPLPLYTRGWSALRGFLIDLGFHEAARLVDLLEEEFERRGESEFV